MGLLDKIEDKMGSSKKNDAQTTRLDNEPGTTTNTTTNTTSGLTSDSPSRFQHPIGSSTTGPGASGITGGTAVDSAGSSNVTGMHSQPGYTGDRQTGTGLTGGSTATSTVMPDRSRNDMSGTDTYGASQSRATAGDLGSRRDHMDTSTTTAIGGPHGSKENRDAIPTAGGEKLGSTGAAYDSPSQGLPLQQQEHHGLTGASTTRTADYSNDTSDKSTKPPHNSNLLNKLDPRVDADRANTVDQTADRHDRHDRHDDHHDRHDGHHGRHGRDRHDNNDHHDRHPGYATNKMGGGGGAYGAGYETGYEAGYRDAVAHLQGRHGGNRREGLDGARVGGGVGGGIGGGADGRIGGGRF